MNGQEQEECAGPPAWPRCAAALGLAEGQNQRLLALVNAYKSAFTELVSRPAAEGPAPLVHMAERLKEGAASGVPLQDQPLALLGAFAAFTAYCAEASPKGDTATYADLIERCRLQYTGEMEALLDKRQRALFRMSVAPRMLDMDTGHDPFGEAIGRFAETATVSGTPRQRDAVVSENSAGYSLWEVIARVNQASEASDFAILAQALGLDQGQQDLFRNELNRLKDAVAGLMALEDKEGTSPARFLARSLMGHGGRETPELKRDFMTYLGTASPEGDTATFRQRFVAVEEEAHARLCALLTGEQLAAFRTVSPGTLPEVRTGYDPVGPVVRAAMAVAEDAPPAGGKAEEMDWAEVAAHLALVPEQEADFRELVARLQEEFRLLHAAPAKDNGPAPLSILEDAQREAIDPAAALARFREYAAAARHHLLGRSYTEVFAGIEAGTRGRLAKLLRPEQARRLAALPVASLVQVRLLPDPEPANVSDEDSGARDAALRRTANALKDEALDLYLQPPEGGGDAPFALLCDGLRRGDVAAEARFQAVLRTRKPAGRARTYARELAECEALKKAEYLAQAPAGHRKTWRKALPPLLLSLETGYNPLLARLRQELGAAAPDTPAP